MAPAPARLRPTPLARGIAQAMGGFGLLELLAGTGITLVAAGLVFAGYQHAHARAQVRNEVDNLQQLSLAIERSFGNVGSYAAVSSQRVLADHLAPWRLEHSPSQLTNAWGGQVSVSPYTVNSAGDGFQVLYRQVPRFACVPLASRLSKDAWDVRVGTVSVLQATGGMDPAVLARECAQSNGELAFVFHSGLASGQAVAADPLVFPTAPPGLPPTPATPGTVPGLPPVPGVPPAVIPPGTVLGCGPAPAVPACPTGPGYAFVPAPFPSCWALSGACDAAAPTPTPLPPYVAPPPPGDPPDPDFVAPCVPSSQDRVAACASGQYGQRSETRALQCGPDPDVREAWAPYYTPGPWTLVSSTCAACPAPATESTYQWVASAAACPAGTYGTHDWERQQQATRSVSYSCPSPTWSLPPPTFGGWSAWSNTGATRNVANTCTACPSVPAQYETRWLTSAPNCPAGSYGQRSWEYEQARSRSGAYACPAGTTTLPPVSWAPWSSWTNTGATRNAVDTCTNCPASTTQTDTQPNEYRAQAWCPAGQFGQHYQYRTVTNARTVSYTCPAGTTALPAASYSTWTTTYGAWTTTSTDCAACPAPATDTQSDWEARSTACPSGQVGTITWEELRQRSRSVSYACPAGSTSLPAPTYGAYGTWSWTGNTRNAVSTCATQCVAPPPSSTPISRPLASQTRDTCPASYSGATPEARTVQEAGMRTTSWACATPTASPTSTTTDSWSGSYTYGPWTPNGADTCTAPPPACVAPPSSSTPISRTLANQNQNVGCPAGQAGAHWQARTVDEAGTRTTSYACPAPTGSWTSTTSDSWTGNYTYGSWTTTSNTCAPADGVCPSRPVTLGCAVFDQSSGAQASAVELGDNIGLAFSSGQRVECQFGYSDALQADGFPMPLSGSDSSQLLFRVRASDQWFYDFPEDSSSYLTVSAKKADGTAGARCFGESKTIYNYEESGK